ncbi:unnamed protein product [Spirodela intermedia]|nr:unnamed protein product [Spirodela intermedia]
MALRDAVAAVFFFVVITVVPFSLAAAGTLAVVALAKAAHRLLRGGPPGGGGLPDKEIGAIPVCVYAAAPPGGGGGGERRDRDCAVCLADFEEGELLRRLGCGHCYHRDCIGRWLRRRATCPKCSRLVSVEMKTEEGLLRRWAGRWRRRQPRSPAANNTLHVVAQPLYTAMN